MIVVGNGPELPSTAKPNAAPAVHKAAIRHEGYIAFRINSSFLKAVTPGR